MRLRGRVFEDFHLGDVYDHHWGRTVTESDNLLFTASTLQVNPIFFNAEAASAQGHRTCVVAPMLVFAVVFGLSVEDLSERGGAFLGVENLSFLQPVYPGTTLKARSTVTNLRDSRSDERHGIATWLTEGFDQTGAPVIRFTRSNLVIRRAFAA